MESHVKIKASQKEMEDLFENDEFISGGLYERTDTVSLQTTRESNPNNVSGSPKLWRV